MQTDQESTPHVSGQPNSTPGPTHPREIERPCRHSITPFPDVRYRMVSSAFRALTREWGIYQMAIANTLRDTSGAEVRRNPALKSLLRNIEMERAPSTSFSRIESRLSLVSIDKTTFRTARPNIGSVAYLEDSFPHRAYFRQTSGRNPCL